MKKITFRLAVANVIMWFLFGIVAFFVMPTTENAYGYYNDGLDLTDFVDLEKIADGNFESIYLPLEWLIEPFETGPLDLQYALVCLFSGVVILFGLVCICCLADDSLKVDKKHGADYLRFIISGLFFIYNLGYTILLFVGLIS